MSAASKFQVVISGRVLPECDRIVVIHALAELFHTAPDTAEKLLQGRATVLKKIYAVAQAEVICQQLRALGAHCRVIAYDAGRADLG